MRATAQVRRKTTQLPSESLSYNSSSRSSAEAPQQKTFKPQNVHQISKNEMKTQETGVKCKMEKSKQVFIRLGVY